MALAKSLQSIPQAPEVQPQQHPGPADVLGRVTDLSQFPLRLGAEDMQRIFEIRKSAFYKFRKLGKFDRMEILPRLGARAWSRALVQEHLDGAVTRRKFAPVVVTGGRK